MENRSRCRSRSGGGRSTIFDTVGADRGGRNPLHYNGASSPLGVKSDVFIDIGLQTWSYCRGNIHIWKTDRAAARDLEGVGAPSSILLEQIGGVGGDLKRLDKTRHFRNMRPHFLDTVVHSGRKWRFGTRASQKGAVAAPGGDRTVVESHLAARRLN